MTKPAQDALALICIARAAKEVFAMIDASKPQSEIDAVIKKNNAAISAIYQAA